MDVDNIVKVLLAGSCAFALVGISYALIKFINKLTSTVEDARKPIQNVSEVTDMALGDYKSVRGVVSNAFGAASFFRKVSSFLPSKEEEENPEEKD